MPSDQECNSAVNMVSYVTLSLQDAIQEQKANLTGLPEGLRQEASELKAQLSCMTLVDRLEGLKDSLVCTSVDDGGVSGEECLSATLNAVNALYAAEKTELETDLADMMSSLKVRTSLVLCMHCLSHDRSRTSSCVLCMDDTGCERNCGQVGD